MLRVIFFITGGFGDTRFPQKDQQRGEAVQMYRSIPAISMIITNHY